jgi:hypothetical protein
MDDPEGEGYLAIINAGIYADKKIDKKYISHDTYINRNIHL